MHSTSFSIPVTDTFTFLRLFLSSAIFHLFFPFQYPFQPFTSSSIPLTFTPFCIVLTTFCCFNSFLVSPRVGKAERFIVLLVAIITALVHITTENGLTFPLLSASHQLNGVEKGRGRGGGEGIGKEKGEEERDRIVGGWRKGME